MADYDVYQHPRTGKYRAVKQGFCWPAFFLGSFWAFSRRLYLLGIVVGGFFSAFLLVGLMTSSQSFPLNSIASGLRVAAQVLFAWFANDIHRWALSLRGFEKCNTIAERWPSRAIRRHIGGTDNETNGQA